MNGVVVESKIEDPELEKIKELINTRLEELETETSKKTAAHDMINQALQNDPAFVERKEDADDSRKLMLGTRREILRRPDMKAISEKKKESMDKIKDIKDTLSTYLEVYEAKTGLNYFEDKKGTVRTIKKRLSIAPGQGKLF